MLRRTDKNPIANWWWTVDRLMFGAALLLIFLGVVLSFASSPAVAERLGLDSLHFVIRHAAFVPPAIAVLVATSLMRPDQVRRIAFLVFVAALILTVATLFIGTEAKGAKRWLYVAGFSLQPSEFLKPAFVVVAAWLFAEGQHRPDMPGTLLACVLLGPVIGLLVMQPDFGQTLLITCTWGAMFFMAGMSWVWIVVFGALGLGGILAAYLTTPHVASRIDRFLNPGAHDTYQIDRAIEAFVSGGWFGRGPGEGTVKQALPDSHTDFIFAVAGEEFGAVLCLVIVAVFGFVVLRGLARAYREEDPFLRLAASGLTILIGLQATINMAVNLSLIPAKGMTLPFISYGGSSLVSVAFSMGVVLALTRRRPQAIALRNAPRAMILGGEAAR